MLHGKVVSEGVAIAAARIHKVGFERREGKITPDEVAAELEKVKKSLNKSKKQLQKIYSGAKETLSEEEAEIFAVHIAFLEDPYIINGIQERISERLMPAVAAISSVIEEYSSLFDSIEDEYLKERKADLREVGSLLTSNILDENNINTCDKSSTPESYILVVNELRAGDFFAFGADKSLLKGIIAETGNETSHASILSRSFDIPYIINVKDAVRKIKDNDLIILDAFSGQVLLNPDSETLNSYIKRLKEYEDKAEKLKLLVDVPCVTADGTSVKLYSNAGSLQDIEKAMVNGAAGIGLFRTEFLFMERESLPTEDEQYEIYLKAVQLANDSCVVIRTLDVGGDKEIPYLGLKKEDNPFLGMRGARFALQRKDILISQLRAIYRASAYGKIRILFPMITTHEEVKELIDITKAVKEGLAKSNIPFDADVRLGIMIETPAAALIADTLLKEVDFASIGTNDLCQYTLAVDRVNPEVSYLYDTFHPAVIHLISHVINQGNKYGKDICMCGEMASNPIAVPMLLKMGLREFSVSPSSLLKIKETILSSTIS